MRGRQEGRKGGCGDGTHRNMHLSVCPSVSPTMLGHNGQFKMICIIVIFKCNSHLQPIKLLEFLWRYKGAGGIRKAWITSILWGSTTKIIRESFCGFVIMEAFFLSKSHESSENIFHISLSVCGFEGLLCYMEFRVHPQHCFPIRIRNILSIFTINKNSCNVLWKIQTHMQKEILRIKQSNHWHAVMDCLLWLQGTFYQRSTFSQSTINTQQENQVIESGRWTPHICKNKDMHTLDKRKSKMLTNAPHSNTLNES